MASAKACMKQGGRACGKRYCNIKGDACDVDEFVGQCKDEVIHLVRDYELVVKIVATDPIAATAEEADKLCAGTLAK